MRVFLTGGTGFIGGRLAQRLRDRGDEVVALVRSRSRATALVGLGCEIVDGDLNDRLTIERAMDGVDSVFHFAARFAVGIPKSEVPALQDVNIGGVRRVMDAAIDKGIERIVYASSVNVFGDTKGATVDETYRRNPIDGFYSAYDECKYRAHVLVEDRIGHGAPIIVVQPGVVYGPGDHFEIGREILLAAQNRLPALMLVNVGINMTFIDDVVDGILRAHDKGKLGEKYILGGENTRLRDVLHRAAELGGNPLTAREVPTLLLKAVAPLGPLVGPRMGYPPNMKELINAADNKTYWASDAKARKELDYAPRSLDEGLRATLEAAHIPVVVADQS